LAKWIGDEMEDKTAWFDSQQVQGTYLFSETSGPGLGTAQLPTQLGTDISCPENKVASL